MIISKWKSVVSSELRREPIKIYYNNNLQSGSKIYCNYSIIEEVCELTSIFLICHVSYIQMKIRKNGRILNNRETPKIMPYKSAITPPLLSNSQIDSCLSRDIYQ